MIRVARIVGESFNLETKEEMPKALVLTNGHRELSLFVDDDVAKEVLQMMMEVEARQKINGKISVPAQPPIPVADPAVQRSAAKPKAPTMAAIEQTPVTTDEPPEFEPGEEYNDPATGAGSL